MDEIKVIPMLLFAIGAALGVVGCDKPGAVATVPSTPDGTPGQHPSVVDGHDAPNRIGLTLTANCELRQGRDGRQVLHYSGSVSGDIELTPESRPKHLQYDVIRHYTLAIDHGEYTIDSVASGNDIDVVLGHLLATFRRELLLSVEWQ